jgi:epoxyqueuosine reductase QueG
MDFVTRIPEAADVTALAASSEALWPEGDAAEHAAELHAVLQAPGIASDTWLDNAASQRAHEKLGFQEVDRVITYRKALDPDIALGPHARPPLAQPPGQ